MSRRRSSARKFVVPKREVFPGDLIVDPQFDEYADGSHHDWFRFWLVVASNGSIASALYFFKHPTPGLIIQPAISWGDGGAWDLRRPPPLDDP